MTPISRKEFHKCFESDEVEGWKEAESTLNRAGNLAWDLHDQFLYKTDLDKAESDLIQLYEDLDVAYVFVEDKKMASLIKEYRDTVRSYREIVKNGKWPSYYRSEKMAVDLWNMESKSKKMKIDTLYDCVFK